MDRNIMLNENTIPSELVGRAETIDAKAQLTKALSLLDRYPAVIVNKDSRYYGMVDSRSFYDARVPLLFQKNQTIEKFIARVPAIDGSTRIDEVVRLFYKMKARALPFMEDKRITGIIDRNTLLRVLLSLRMVAGVKVSDAMSSPVIAISDEVGISQAKAVMEGKRIRRLVAVHKGRFSGMLTYSAIIRSYTMQAGDLPEMKPKANPPNDIGISGIIERNPKTVGAEKELSYATRHIVEHGISSLIVTERGSNPIGMLTASDILESVMSRRRLEYNRIFVSGFDGQDVEYEPEIREELKGLVKRMDKTGFEVDYLRMHVKRIRNNRYDIALRVSTKNRGMVSAHITDFLLDRTFKGAVSLLKRDMAKEKGRILKGRKGDGMRMVD